MTSGARAQETILELAAQSWVIVTSLDDGIARRPTLVTRKRQLVPVVLQRNQIAEGLARHLERKARDVDVVAQRAEPLLRTKETKEAPPEGSAPTCMPRCSRRGLERAWKLCNLRNMHMWNEPETPSGAHIRLAKCGMTSPAKRRSCSAPPSIVSRTYSTPTAWCPSSCARIPSAVS